MNFQGPIFAGYTSAPEDVQSVKAALEIVEEFLTRDKWLAGSKVTLADISFAAIITLLSVSDSKKKKSFFLEY